MYPMVEQELTRQAEIEARRQGVEARRLRDAEAYARAKARPQVEARVDKHETVDVVIREAEAGDLPALLRLAELDSQSLPDGKLLVAEAGGRIRAARAVHSKAVIADPFVATGELRALLKLRANQVKRESRGARRGGVLTALHLRPGRTA